jgi:hypothetical protein
MYDDDDDDDVDDYVDDLDSDKGKVHRVTGREGP